MKPLLSLRGTSVAGILSACAAAHAHAPVLDCYIKQDQVQCEAGFSDGSSAAGKKIQVLDARNKVLLEGVLDNAGTYVFKPPGVDYHVVFLGGDNHQTTLYSSNITQ